MGHLAFAGKPDLSRCEKHTESSGNTEALTPFS